MGMRLPVVCASRPTICILHSMQAIFCWCASVLQEMVTPDFFSTRKIAVCISGDFVKQTPAVWNRSPSMVRRSQSTVMITMICTSGSNSVMWLPRSDNPQRQQCTPYWSVFLWMPVRYSRRSDPGYPYPPCSRLSQ